MCNVMSVIMFVLVCAIMCLCVVSPLPIIPMAQICLEVVVTEHDLFCCSDGGCMELQSLFEWVEPPGPRDDELFAFYQDISIPNTNCIKTRDDQFICFSRNRCFSIETPIDNVISAD